ncbi:hypothetical protein HZB05_01540 [Candidatus Wolfebacteria bacterium]|nr:hypothetical protein [Candidatus Wolfebacteria bacterium]
MKKLKLVGIKKGWFGRKIKKNVADIYVQDNKVIVESKYQKSREELQKELDRLAYIGAFGIRKSREIKDKKGNVTDIQDFQINQRPGDQKFLEALAGCGWFWDDKKFDGYEVYETISKIVEE